jgi:hypothetical protein
VSQGCSKLGKGFDVQFGVRKAQKTKEPKPTVHRSQAHHLHSDGSLKGQHVKVCGESELT